MMIRLSAEQERRLLRWAGSLTEAEINADVEPGGYELRVSITPGLGCFAEAIKGSWTLEIGEVEVILQQQPAGEEVGRDQDR